MVFTAPPSLYKACRRHYSLLNATRIVSWETPTSRASVLRDYRSPKWLRPVSRCLYADSCCFSQSWECHERRPNLLRGL